MQQSKRSMTHRKEEKYVDSKRMRIKKIVSEKFLFPETWGDLGITDDEIMNMETFPIDSNVVLPPELLGDKGEK